MANKIKNMVESIKVRVPPPKPRSSPPPPPPNPRTRCNHSTDCRSAARFVIQNYTNFSRSAAPARFMYYQNGSWLDFSSEVLQNSRLGFSEGKSVIEASIDGSKHIFDFTSMLQIDTVTAKRRSIAWIDDNGKSFFPKMFVDDDEFHHDFAEKSENPVIEIEIKIDGCSSVKRKREDDDDDDEEELVKEEVEVSSYNKRENNATKRQRLVTADAESSRWANARILREEEKDYALVRDHFMAGIKKVDAGVTITAIHQYTGEGPMGSARYQVFQKQIEITRAARGVANIVYAWYGASAKEVESVLAHGFGMPSKVSGSNSYGVGVNLSPLGLPYLSAKLAEADDNGEKHLILCRVILGTLEKVEAGCKQSHPSRADFDNGVDDPKNPKWYVVWSTNMNRHILPECVVSFKSPNILHGTKFSFEKLLSKMKGFLPPMNVRVLQNLYDNLKAGKLTRDVFLKHLRSVAGDEVLLSIIREIRANE